MVCTLIYHIVRRFDDLMNFVINKFYNVQLKVKDHIKQLCRDKT